MNLKEMLVDKYKKIIYILEQKEQKKEDFDVFGISFTVDIEEDIKSYQEQLDNIDVFCERTSDEQKKIILEYLTQILESY